MYNLKYNLPSDERNDWPVAIEVKCADVEQGFCDVLNALRDEMIEQGDIRHDEDPWEHYYCQLDTLPADSPYDIRVTFDAAIVAVAHDIDWRDVFTLEGYIGARHGIRDNCGFNADWCVSAYHLGNGAPNHEPGGIYLIDNEDGTWDVSRRYHVEDGYAPAPDVLRAALPTLFDGSNDAVVPLVERAEPLYMANWLDHHIEGIRDRRICIHCGAESSIPTGMPVPF